MGPRASQERPKSAPSAPKSVQDRPGHVIMSCPRAQKHKRTHNDDTSRVFGFGCDVGFDCGSCLGWTKHAGHVIPFAVQPMQEPQSKAISQPKPKNRDMSSCCVGATLPYLSCLRGGISKAVPPYIGCAQEQISVAGVPSLLFRSVFSILFLYPPNLPKPSHNPSQNRSKIDILDNFFLSFFLLHVASILC